MNYTLLALWVTPESIIVKMRYELHIISSVGYARLDESLVKVTLKNRLIHRQCGKCQQVVYAHMWSSMTKIGFRQKLVSPHRSSKFRVRTMNGTDL